MMTALRRVRGPRAALYECAIQRGPFIEYRYFTRTVLGFRRAIACSLL